MDKLNARAGIYALSFTLWHGTTIVSPHLKPIHETPPGTEILTPDCPIDISTSHRRLILHSAQRSAQGRALQGSDEGSQILRQDLFLRIPRRQLLISIRVYGQRTGPRRRKRFKNHRQLSTPISYRIGSPFQVPRGSQKVMTQVYFIRLSPLMLLQTT